MLTLIEKLAGCQREFQAEREHWERLAAHAKSEEVQAWAAEQVERCVKAEQTVELARDDAVAIYSHSVAQ